MFRIICITLLVAVSCHSACAKEDSVISKISSAWNVWRGSKESSGSKDSAQPFSDLPKAERARIVILAKCANAAYPGVEPPIGYRVFSGEDWSNCVLGRHYEGCRYDDNGYLYVGSGLRARFLENSASHDLVIAWSGCDIDQIRNGDFSGIADAKTVIAQYRGKISGGQLEQAAKIFNGVLMSYPGRRIDVVGHSLGGAITTYVVAVAADSEERVHGITFNGLGFSESAVAKNITPWRKQRAAKHIVNIKCDKDPVYAGLLVSSTHYGKTYNIPYSGVVSHSMDTLISLMEDGQ